MTPFGAAKWLGSVGISLREDSNGIFDIGSGEYVALYGGS